MQSYSIQEMDLLLRVLEFAAERHIKHHRKDELGSPYINHPIKVAQLIWEVGEVRDVEVLAAALLHDTIEDVDVTYEEIVALFSRKIADIVQEVTDDKSLLKEVRKQKQVEHAPFLSHEAKLVKLGDKICNVEDIQNNPPRDWQLERRLDYLKWASDVVAGLRGANPRLEARFDQAVQSARKSLSK